MKCGRICLSHGGQLPVLHRRKGSQHFTNQAKFHSTFPIWLLLKSLIVIHKGIVPTTIKISFPASGADGPRIVLPEILPDS